MITNEESCNFLTFQTSNKLAPLEFVRSNLKTILGSMLDRKVAFPAHRRLTMRQYNINMSPRPRTGKGESWERTGQENVGFLWPLLQARQDQHILDGGILGSGEYMAKTLSAYNGSQVIARFDELIELFQKDQTKASTLETKFLTLFERRTVSQGSFANKQSTATDVGFSFSGDCVEDKFHHTFQGRGSQGSGLLSRSTLSYADATSWADDWLDIDGAKALQLVNEIDGCLKLAEFLGANNIPFIPPEDRDAKQTRLEFFRWLRQEDQHFAAELEAHFKRDLLLRVIFSGATDKSQLHIDLDKTQRSIAWTKHQLILRERLWPDDAGTPVEIMSKKIVEWLKKHSEPQSDRQLRQGCNIGRLGSGGPEVYNRAIRALVGSHTIGPVSKTQKGYPKYGLLSE